MSISLEDGRRIYRRWSENPRAYNLMTTIAFFGRREALRGKAIDRLRLSSGDRVLDLGCGMGPNLADLAGRVGPTGSVVGLDASGEMLEVARDRVAEAGIGGRVELVEADAAEHRFESACFGGALAALSLSAVPDRTGALERVHEGLRPGARLVVFDAVPFTGAWSWLNPVVEPLFQRLTNWDASADLPGEMEAAGFRVEVESFNLDSAIIATATKPS